MLIEKFSDGSFSRNVIFYNLALVNCFFCSIQSVDLKFLPSTDPGTRDLLMLQSSQIILVVELIR